MSEKLTVGDVIVSVVAAMDRRAEAEVAELYPAKLKAAEALKLPPQWAVEKLAVNERLQAELRHANRQAKLWRRRYERLREAVEPVRRQLADQVPEARRRGQCQGLERGWTVLLGEQQAVVLLAACEPEAEVAAEGGEV